MKARVFARHIATGSVHTFILSGKSLESISEYFEHRFPTVSMYRIDPITVDIIPERRESERRNTCSPAKRRGHYKARLCQVRGNLQSMTDSEYGLLTTEEILVLQRISCKLDRVIALFNTRTMDLKRDGLL